MLRMEGRWGVGGEVGVWGCWRLGCGDKDVGVWGVGVRLGQEARRRILVSE